MIKDIQELNFPTYATMSAATVSLPDMGEWNITSQIKIDGQIAPDFSFDWEVVHDGHKYIMPLRKPQGSKENKTLNSVIDLTFQHWAIYQLKRFPFVTMQPIDSGTAVADEEVATVSLNLGDFCNLFGQVLNYYYGDKITIDLNDDPETGWQYKAEAEVITISHTKVWNVLIEVFYKQFGVRWQIEPNGSYDKYVIKVGYPTTEQSHIFEYGFEGGLMKVERQVQSDEICNLLKGRGGDKNLPYRYFKNVDPENDSFKADPDWIEELANIYFSNLMPATFRSYVQGWKAAHLNATDSEGNLLYEGYEPVGEANAYAPWAYRKGFTDTKFHPVEFVADEITVTPEVGDRQVEILPGYSPFVKKGSSLDKYGALMNSLDNNEDIYPTIQGVTIDPYGRIDEAVYVEEIVSDDVEGAAESDAQITTIKGDKKSEPTEEMARLTITVDFPEFTVEKDKTATLEPGVATIEAFYINFFGKHEYISDSIVLKSSPVIAVTNVETNQSQSASGIPEGRWKWSATFDVEVDWESGLQHSKQQVLVTVGYESPKLIQSTLTNDKWTNTFDILVKNIWGTSKQDDETNEQYAKRVWEPILGDRVGNEAKVVFASGALSISEDYEFTIVDIPKYEQKTCAWQTVEGGNTVNHEYLSEWRITLAKSDADLDTLGTYVPSKMRQGKAGDFFFFIGIDMPHQYTVWNEIRIDDDWKKPILGEKKDIKPTWVVQTDRVRLNNEGKPDALIRQLHPGDTLRLADKRFIEGDYETLYLSSLTITYREPTSDDAALNPDVEIVLSDRYEVSANPVATLQGEVSALAKQVGSISNVEQIVRAVGDKLYLRKDGIADRSLSPTEFASLLTSLGFRSGMVGGAGWGIYKDANGNWVIEADRFMARQDLEVNNLVINQVTGQGGTIVESAARMEITRVEDTTNGYKCYFDQHEGTVANLFQVDDIAWNNRFTPENEDLKAYKRRVTEVGADYVVLSKTDVNGTGIPSEGDVIVQRGNYTDANRQYIKVRDVIGGGYERFVGNLNSVDAEGVQYHFVGRTAGELPQWFTGERDLIPYSGEGDGSYIEFANHQFNLNNVTLSVGSKIGDKTLGDIIQGIDASKYLREALNQSTIVDNGLVLTSAILLGRTNQIGERETWAGHNGLYNNPKTIASFWGGDMVDRYYDENGNERTTPLATGFAASLIRMDGSGYFSKGAFSWDAIGNPKFGSGVKVVLGDASEVDLSASVTSFFNFIANLSKAFIPAKMVNGVEQPLPWTAIDEAEYIKALYTISSVGDLQAFGHSDSTGGNVGGASALADLVDVALTNPTQGQSLVYDGTHWVNQSAGLNETQLLAYLTANNYAKKSDIPSLSGYATETWVTNKGYLTAVAWGDVTGKPTWIGATKPSYNFSEIGSKPTTIAGYGITDAKIAGGVITLGADTITPLVAADMKTLTFQSGTFSAKTYTPNSAAVTVNIPTTTSHISEGTNKYFTDARAQAALATTVTNINAAIGLKLDKSFFDKLFTVVYDTDGTTVLYVKSPYTFVSEKDLQAFGYGATSGGSGSAINILSSWANYGDSTKGYALSAELGYGLRERITTLEGKNYLDALNLTTSGSGNAVTAVSLSADKKTLTVTKGATFLTSHQAIRTLTIQKNGTTVDTFNPTATANKTINITDVASAATLSSHTGNTTVHITAAERTLWNTTATNLSAILGSDTDNVINKYEEIVAFLDTYTEADTLANLLSNKADKTTQIIAGTGLTGGGTLAADRTLSLATSGVTAGTYTKLTVDAYGRATSGSNPNTLAGYGITDAYTKTDADNRYVNVSGDTMTGVLTVPRLIISSTDYISHLAFSRGNYNYITAPEGGSIAFIPNNKAIGSANTDLLISDKTITPGQQNNAVILGNTSYRWKNVYSVLGDFSTSVKIGSATLTYNATYDCLISDKTIVSEKDIQAFGASSSSGGSGSANINMLTSWANYNASTEGYVPIAKIVYDSLALKLEASDLNGYATQSWVNSQGFLKQSSLNNYVTINTAQDITAVKTFKGVSLKIQHPSALGGSARGVAFAGYDGTHYGAVGTLTSGNVFRYTCIGWDELWYDENHCLALSADIFKYKNQNVLHAGNTYISGGVITINGTSITPVTSLANYYTKTEADGKYVTLSTTQTITGAKTFKSGKLNVSASANTYTQILSSTNTAIPTADADYAWYIYHANEASGFRGLSIWSYDGDNKVFNQVATLKSNGGNRLVVKGAIEGNSIIKYGGTSTQFLKADGSVDSNSYALASSLGNYLPLAGGTMANTNLVTNLNADLLNGKHNGDLTARYFSPKLLTSADDLNTVAAGVYSAINTDNPQNSFSYNTAYVSLNTNNRNDKFQFAVSANTKKIAYRVFGDSISTVLDWIEIATVNSNVASASRLATTDTYKAWGQNFFYDGVPHTISGNMTGVGSITASADITITTSTANSVRHRATNSNGTIDLLTSANRGLYEPNKLTWVIATNGTNTWLSLGNVGIGTTSPAYMLDVNGTVRATALRLGSVTLYDGGGYLLVDKTIVSSADVQAFGQSDTSGGGGGTIFNLLKNWSNYSSDKADSYAISAGLGYGLHNRLTSVESNYLSITTAAATYQPKGNYLTSHQTLNHIKYVDRRDNSLAPYDAGFTNKGVEYGLKYNSVDGLNDGGTFHGIMTLHPWSNSSGGYAYQLGFTANGNIHQRSGTTAWGDWKKLLDTANYATTLDNAYLKLTGGTLTGTLTIQSNAFGTQLNIARTTNGAVGIKYSNSLGLLGYIGIGGSGSPIPNDVYFTRGSDNNDTDHRIWHSGNDGSGSGLDADLLDGWHRDEVRKGVLAFTCFQGESVVGGYDLNTLAPDGGIIRNYGSPSYWCNAPQGAQYGFALHLKTNSNLGGMLFADSNHNGTTDVTRSLWWRSSASVNNVKTWGQWHQIAFTDSNVASATKLATARSINGTSFDGTGDITTSKWGTARNVYIQDYDGEYTGAATSVNGSAAVYLKMPSEALFEFLGVSDIATDSILSGSLNVLDATTLNGTLSVSGAATLASTLSVTGDITGNAALTVPTANITGKTVFRYGGTAANYIAFEESADGKLNIFGRAGTAYNSLGSFNPTSAQLSLFKLYIGTSLSFDNASVIYGSPAIAVSERYYFDHNRTKYMHYDSANGVFRLNGTLVVDGDVQAFGASTPGSKIKRVTITGVNISDNRTLSIPTDVTDVIVDISGDLPLITLALDGDTAQMDITRIYVYDRGIGGSEWKYGSKKITVTSGKAKMMTLVKYANGIMLTE